MVFFTLLELREPGTPTASRAISYIKTGTYRKSNDKEEKALTDIQSWTKLTTNAVYTEKI